MTLLIRLLFWPILLLLVSTVSFVFHLPVWSIFWQWFIHDPTPAGIFWRLFELTGLVLLVKYTIYNIRFTYAWYASKKLQSFKVILPRSDSKMDQEKRTEKDFKEKIAIMEQLFRALYEVKDLTFWQAVHFWLFRFVTISFELYTEAGQITFYVLMPKELISIVEKQVTSFYPLAEVAPQKTPEIWPAGYKLVGYNMIAKKSYMFPFRYYDHMQDDPLNDIANVLSKLDEGETATVQVVITPSFSDKWSRRTKDFASRQFKGKKANFFAKIPGLRFLGIAIAMIASSDGAKNFAPGAHGGDSFVRMIQPEEELYKRMGEKAGMSGFHTSVRIMAAAKTWSRAIDITNNMQVAFNVFKDLYGNSFKNRRMFVDFLPLCYERASHLSGSGSTVSTVSGTRKNLMVEKELASLFHFPDSRYNKIPNIQWITYKDPSAAAERAGRRHHPRTQPLPRRGRHHPLPGERPHASPVHHR